LAVTNGRLYGTGYNGGQLGGVFRYEGGTNWTNFGAPPGVDQTYSFAFHNGEMHVGTWKEGKVFRCAGSNSYSDAGRLGAELEVVAMRQGRRLQLFVDGRRVATSTEFNPADFDLTNHEPLKIGFGAHDYFNGRLSDLRIYRRALTAGEVSRLSSRRAVAGD